jgi:tripartite-type tricarboxylate transporter receptor subunit TctC
MRFLKSLLAGAIALGMTTSIAVAGSHDWQPKKPVEFIIMAGAGGGADQIARLLQGIIEKKGLSPRPFIPMNKPGGSGAEALRYLQDKSGDDHTVMMTLNSFYTTPIIQKDLGVDPTEFTPIGLMAMDPCLWWVHSDQSDITDINSYVSAVKAAGKDWKVGGTGSGQEDSVLTAMMEAEFGYGVTYIPFPGGGTVAKNLIGKQIDSTVNNPSEQMAFYKAGDSKPLIQFTGKRMAAFPDVPTAKELGINIEYYMQRSVNGPPGMSDGAVKFYTNLFQELFDSKEWQDFCTSDGLTCDMMIKNADLAKFHADQYAAHEKLIAQVGASAITGE